MSRIYHAKVYREIEIDVWYTVTPGYAGDRIDPPCDGEIEIDSAMFNGMAAELTADEIAEVFAAHEDDGPDPDDLRDRMIDDRLTA